MTHPDHNKKSNLQNRHIHRSSPTSLSLPFFPFFFIHRRYADDFRFRSLPVAWVIVLTCRSGDLSVTPTKGQWVKRIEGGGGGGGGAVVTAFLRTSSFLLLDADGAASVSRKSTLVIVVVMMTHEGREDTYLKADDSFLDGTNFDELKIVTRLRWNCQKSY